MVKLLSIATALPAGLLPQQKAFEHARSYCCANEREERVLQRLYQRTTIQTRPTIFSASTNGNAASQTSNGVKSQTSVQGRTLDSFYPPLCTAGDTKPNIAPGDNTAQRDNQPSTAARMARYKKEVVPLATTAARLALAKIDMPPSLITNLITVSCTGFFAPGLDTEIIDTLHLPRNITRTHVGFMGCHGAINGLRVGSALATESQSMSLVVAAEICSLHFQYGRKSDDLLANALFADGAAAAILSSAHNNNLSAGRARTEEGLAGDESLSLTATASYLVPETKEAMSWHIGDHGFFMTLGPEVPALIEQHLAPWLEEWLAGFDLDINKVGSWAIHPGGPRVLLAVEQALDLKTSAMAASREIFTSLGNMSSPTILFILERLLAAQAAPPIVALAFGPGLTIEAALFT